MGVAGIALCGVRMASTESIEHTDLEVKAIAENIADTREAIEELSREGKDTSRLHSALVAMTDIFTRRFRYRRLVNESQQPDESGS